MPATLILEIQTEKSLQGQLWHGNNLLHCALEPRGGGGGDTIQIQNNFLCSDQFFLFLCSAQYINDSVSGRSVLKMILKLNILTYGLLACGRNIFLAVIYLRRKISGDMQQPEICLCSQANRLHVLHIKLTF